MPKKKKKTKNENDFTIALLCNIIIRKLNFTHIFHFLSKAENKSSSLSLCLSQSLSLSLSLSHSFTILSHATLYFSIVSKKHAYIL